MASSRPSTSSDILNSYRTFLGRTPAQNEIDYWAGQNLSKYDLARHFEASDEHQARRTGNTTNQFFYGANPQAGSGRSLVNNPNYEHVLSPGQRATMAYSGQTGKFGRDIWDGPTDVAGYEWVPEYNRALGERDKFQQQIGDLTSQLEMYQGLDPEFLAEWKNFTGSFEDWKNNFKQQPVGGSGAGGSPIQDALVPDMANKNRNRAF